uniref:Uncharacterized protein n=1 Tax=Cacopsylla melanoneura TaxID=428564 RepID=A0A8D8R9P9_9HEMI
MLHFLDPVAICFIALNMVNIILCLFQLVASPADISLQRYFKFTAEFISILASFFLYCESSEYQDNNNGMVREALTQCGWETCSTQTKRDLMMLIRRVQRPNYSRFTNGTFELSRLMFLQVVKLAYSFVNFFKSK